MATKRQQRALEERVESRRLATSMLNRRGLTYRTMLERLRADGHRSSLGTIATDIEVMTQRYRDESFRSREESLLLDLERLDVAMDRAWDSAMVKGQLGAMDRVLRIIEQRTHMLGYPELLMREAPGEVAVDSGLTAEEEAMIVRIIRATRSGRSLAPIIEATYKPLPDSLDDPTPLPPGYPES